MRGDLGRAERDNFRRTCEIASNSSRQSDDDDDVDEEIEVFLKGLPDKLDRWYSCISNLEAKLAEKDKLIDRLEAEASEGSCICLDWNNELDKANKRIAELEAALEGKE